MKSSPEKFILVFLIVVGGVLRFYGFPNIPFTYDELSAWGRTDYSSFSQLINQGVRGDGHPALIQVFLFYWRKFFGDSEASFKFPFLLMGLASIYLIFVIGRKWFNETVGMLCAAFFTVLQYTVMYSQIARPYISGLFLSLLMANSWTNFVFGVRRKKSLLGFVIFATLCCYNHYFSLLFAFVVGCSGYFFLPKKEWREYTAVGFIVLVLFVPHIGITLDQMKIGGVGGWLAKPDRNFFGNYLSYAFDFSWWVKGAALLLVMLSIYFISTEWKQKNKFRMLSAAWFFLPIIIGYLYSKYRNPVLQYSVLIFSFPYLLLLLFSFFRNMKPLQQFILSSAVLVVGIYSLIFEREHYEIFYQQPVEEIVKSSVEFVKQHPGKKTYIMIQEPQKYMNYYLSKWKSDVTVHSYQDAVFQDYISAQKTVKNENADYLLCGNVPYPDLQLFRNSYPKIIEAKKGFTYDFFALAKSDDTDSSINEITFQDSLKLSEQSKNWEFNTAQVRTNSSADGRVYHMDSSQEYSASFSAPLQSIMQSRDDYLVLDVAVENAPANSEASLALNFEENGKSIFYQEKPFSLFIDSSGRGHLVNALHFRDFDFTMRNPLVKFYVWNKKRESFDVASMKVIVMKGNPLIYSLIEPVPRSER